MKIITCDKENSIRDSEITEICDRHIRLFGESLQEKLATMTIGIVGVGGLGSVLVEQIMRLYPQKIIIIDKDNVELSNLNRLTNSTLLDAHHKISKVIVAERAIKSFNPKQDSEVINGDFLEKGNQEVFKECDIIIGALDSNAVRFAINQLSVAHGIPYLDCGTGVIIEKKKIKHVGGQVIYITPDSGMCLYCSELFDRQKAMKEFLDNKEQERFENMGYIKGADIIAPQVYSLNMQVASTAVWLFMRVLSGERFSFHGITLDAKAFSLNQWKNSKQNNEDCPICGENGIAFMGDEAELLCKGNYNPGRDPEVCTESSAFIENGEFKESKDSKENRTVKESLSTYQDCFPRLIIGDDNAFLNFGTKNYFI